LSFLLVLISLIKNIKILKEWCINWMDLSAQQTGRYARQIILSEIGPEGQKKLINARALVIGLGGLGSSCAIYLAAAGVGNLGILDFDKVGLDNLHRQIIHSEKYINNPKTESAKNRISQTNSDVKIIDYDMRLTPENAVDLISKYDIISDCTDNLRSRYMVNDACIIAGRPYVHAAVFQFFGQAMTILPGKSACYRCLLPEPPSQEVMPVPEKSGIIGTVAGLMGIIQANEIIKYILGAGELLTGKLLMFDALENSFEKIDIKKNPYCAVCSNSPSIKDLAKNPEHYSSE
jgi:molybdopterin-synthase adenylyltransferase